MGQNRNSRTYFTTGTNAPFHSGSKPAQVDFEDVFETFALRNELGSVAGGLDGWVYHHFISSSINETDGFMYLPIPANAKSVDAMNTFLFMTSGTNNVKLELYLISDAAVSGGLDNATAYVPGSNPSNDIREVITDANAFKLNLFQINFVNATPISTQSVGGTVRKLIYKSPTGSAVKLIGNDFRSLLINVKLDTGNLDTRMRLIGLKFS